jgi:hypothetical protein
MKDFIKNNSVLAAGVALPFLLIIAFALANLTQYQTAEDPRYDFIFSERNYESSNNQRANFGFNVENGKLNVIATKKPDNNDYYRHKLYRYSAKTNTVTEITLPTVQFEETTLNLAPGQQNGVEIHKIAPDQINNVMVYKPVKVSLPELEGMKFNPSTTSPDGYTFSPYSYDRDGGLMFEVFFGNHSSYYGCSLKKHSRIIKIPQDKCRNYENTFIGWIVE